MARHPARRIVTLAAVVLLAALVAPAARAASPEAREATQKAKEFFRRGESYFKLEMYKEALEQYEQGYLAKSDASFLYNIAQCHRLMGDKAAALRFYKRFLNEATRVPNRPVVEQHIRELEAELAAEPPPPPPPPPPVAPEPAVATPAPTLLARPTAAPAADAQPVYMKWWFWTIVGAVAIAGGVGVYAATRSSSSCEAGRVCM